MDPLKQQVKRLLDARELQPQDWSDAEDRLLTTLERRKRPTLWWAVGPMVLSAVAAAWLMVPARPSPRAVEIAAASEPTEIYFRRSADPESTALHITLNIHPGQTR